MWGGGEGEGWHVSTMDKTAAELSPNFLKQSMPMWVGQLKGNLLSMHTGFFSQSEPLPSYGVFTSN
jgi:hypothetical protein